MSRVRTKEVEAAIGPAALEIATASWSVPNFDAKTVTVILRKHWPEPVRHWPQLSEEERAARRERYEAARAKRAADQAKAIVDAVWAISQRPHAGGKDELFAAVLEVLNESPRRQRFPSDDLMRRLSAPPSDAHIIR